jgi:DNA-binding beta-propeller fold protein YncE
MMRAGTGLAAAALAFVAGCGSDPESCDLGSAGTICTIAGSGANGYSGDDGPALEAEMSLPQDTLLAPDGSLYILDWNNHRIRKVTEDGTMLHVAGRGELGGTLDDPANADFNHPTGIVLDPTGRFLVIAAWHNSQVSTLDLENGDIIDICGDGRRAYFGDEGPAKDASLDLPASVAFDPDDNLVIMDQANQVIRMVDGEGVIHRIAGQCVLDRPTPEGPGPCESPVECAGGSGKLTCGDPEATCGGACNPSYGDGAGGALELRMSQPFGQSADPAGRIVFDRDGNLLFSDTANHIIRRIDPDGEVTRVAGLEPVDGAPRSGYSGDGGPADEAELDGPVDLAVADDGTLYFTDVGNNCVRAVDRDGTIRTAVGRCGERGYDGDGGPAEEALLKLPYGVEWARGTLYIADSGNSVIRAVEVQ